MGSHVVCLCRSTETSWVRKRERLLPWRHRPKLWANVESGMKDVAFYSSYHGWWTVMCVIGRVSDMDARAAPWMAACMVGFLAGTMVMVVAFPLCRVGGGRCSNGWLERVLYCS